MTINYITYCTADLRSSVTLSYLLAENHEVCLSGRAWRGHGRKLLHPLTERILVLWGRRYSMRSTLTRSSFSSYSRTTHNSSPVKALAISSLAKVLCMLFWYTRRCANFSYDRYVEGVLYNTSGEVYSICTVYTFLVDLYFAHVPYVTELPLHGW